MDSGWTDREVHHLISIWADEEIQALLELAKRNKAIHESQRNGEGWVKKTAEQCREKIRN